MTKIKILIADDHAVVREGTRAMIERQPGWEVCGVAVTGREAVELAATLEPDVVVMDQNMPGLNGLDAARQIKRRRSGTEILIFTAHQTDDLIREAFTAGVKGVISKSDGPAHLIEAIVALSQHKPFLTGEVSDVLFAEMVQRGGTSAKPDQRGRRLTSREREIVQLLAEGQSNKNIAALLGISLRTVEAHRATLMRKLGLNSLADLVRYAIRHNITTA